jgi:hypothetical protein
MSEEFIKTQTICFLTAALIMVKGEYYEDSYVEALSLYRKIEASVVKARKLKL